MASRNAKQASPSFIIKSLPDIGVGAPEGVDVDSALDGDKDGEIVGLDDGGSVGIAETDTTTATKVNIEGANDFIV